jgi:hypothetical protein
MDDTRPVMTDSSGNNLHGTTKNVAVNQPGKVGRAFGFLTKPSLVTVPTSPKLNPGSGTFSVSAWVKFAAKPSAAVGDYDLVRKGLAGTAGGHWKMEIVQSGSGYCLFKGPSGRVVLTKGPNLADNAWHSIRCTRSGTTVTLTVDGTTYTKNGPTGTIANTAPLLVGAKNASGGDQFSGYLDEVVITAG